MLQPVTREEQIRVVTWERMKVEVKNSPQCQYLTLLMFQGMPEDKKEWPEALFPYYQYRHNLLMVDGGLLCGEGPLPHPTKLAAGAGVPSPRCSPGYNQDVEQSCSDCLLARTEGGHHSTQRELSWLY